MAADWCIPKEDAEKFKRALIAGKINPASLAEMTSAERRATLGKYVGEQLAPKVNALFESKLLLKNREQGYINWAQAVLGGEKTPAGRDAISRARKLDKILSPAQEEAFLDDLAEAKLWMRVSRDEAKRIAEMSAKIAATEEIMNQSPRRPLLGPATPEEMDYGRSYMDLRNYMDELIVDANALKRPDLRAHPVHSAGRILRGVAGFTKSITSGPDFSYLFRQGFKTLINNPGMWKRNALNSFRAAASGFRKQSADAVMHEINASIVSRPTFEEMVRGGLALGIHEEAYPSAMPQKIPGLGRIYAGSDAAFSAFQQLNRADTFDVVLEKALAQARKSGLEVQDDELRAIARFAGSMTARGHLGSWENKVGLLNSLFFSPRNAKATIDLFTHAFTGAGGASGGGSPVVRRQAQIALAKYVIAVAGILLVARMLLGQAGVDFDFRGTDAGKIKIRKDSRANKVAAVIASIVGVGVDSGRNDNLTRYEVTASAAGYVTLLVRMALHAVNAAVPKKYEIKNTKNTSTGRTGFIPKGIYGLPMVMLQFMENKFSPAAAAINEDVIMQKTRDKQDPTPWTTLKTLIEPMLIRDIQELN